MDGKFTIQMRDGSMRDVCQGTNLKMFDFGQMIRITKQSTYVDSMLPLNEPGNMQTFEDFIALVNLGPGDVLLFWPRS